MSQNSNLSTADEFKRVVYNKKFSKTKKIKTKVNYSAEPEPDIDIQAAIR